MMTVLSILALVLAIIPHEVMHGLVALRFGDPTAKNQGRLTLNPVKHIDPIGSILLPGLLIVAGSPLLLGWAKPVPIRMDYFRRPFHDMMWVALAGPLTNLSMAFVSGILLKLLPPIPYFTLFLAIFIQINVILAVFNLLPIPPLDGSRVLARFLPDRWREGFYRVEPFGFLIIFALAYFGLFSWLWLIIEPLSGWFL